MEMGIQHSEKGPKWSTVIIVLILFWPVGLYLLYTKLKTDRSKQLTGGKAILIAGIVTFVFFLMMAIVALISPPKAENPNQNPAGAAVVLFICAIGGAFMINKGNKLQKKAIVTKKYLNLIINQSYSSITDIAGIMKNNDLEKTVEDIQGLIEDGFLPNYKIDYSLKLIEKIKLEDPVFQTQARGSRAAFTCTACGANNELMDTGGSLRCEYCQTPRKA